MISSTKRKVAPKKKKDIKLVRKALIKTKNLYGLLHNTFKYEGGKLYRISKRTLAGVQLKEAGYISILTNGKAYSKIGISSEGINIYFSRSSLVYLMHTGVYENRLEHLNGDTLDDRIENLTPKSRHITDCRIMKGKTNTGIRNIFRRDNKFIVACNMKGKRYNLGTFKTLEEAKNGLLEGYKKLKNHQL